MPAAKHAQHDAGPDPGPAYQFVARSDDRAVADDDAVPYLGCTDEALELVRSVGASSVVVATTSISLDSANRLARRIND